MIIVETILTVYTIVVLAITGAVSDITGLYPREQLAYVQQVQGLPETTGFSDTISSGVLK